MSEVIERPPTPAIGPIGNLTVRVKQSQADAMIVLFEKGPIFTDREFGEALGAERQARSFLRSAAKRGLIVIVDDGALFMWRRA